MREGVDRARSKPRALESTGGGLHPAVEKQRLTMMMNIRECAQTAADLFKLGKMKTFWVLSYGTVEIAFAHQRCHSGTISASRRGNKTSQPSYRLS